MGNRQSSQNPPSNSLEMANQFDYSTASSSNPAREKLLGLQMGRGAAAWLVLLFHLATTLDWRESLGEMAPYDLFAFFEAIGIVGVDLFFVISGVVMTVTCFERLGDRSAVVPFLKRRIARVYPLYWACTAAVLALCWFMPALASRTKTDPVDILRSLLLLPQRDYPIVGVGWTLTYEMYFYLVFALLMPLPRRFFLAALGLWAGSALALFFMVDDPANRGIQGNLALPLVASPLVLEFIAGCFIGWLLKHGALPHSKLALGVGIAWLLVIGTHYGANHFDEAAYGVVRIGVFGVPSILIIYGTLGLERCGRLWHSPSMVFWGDASYSLYLTHAYVLYAFAVLLSRWPLMQQGPAYWTLIGSCLITCGAVGAITYRWVERPLTKSAQLIMASRT